MSLRDHINQSIALSSFSWRSRGGRGRRDMWEDVGRSLTCSRHARFTFVVCTHKTCRADGTKALKCKVRVQTLMVPKMQW